MIIILGLEQEISTACRSILLTHGQRTEKAVVLFHGYTNCPQQFRELGQILYEQGYNALIPRLPRHGLADRKVENLSPLTAEELRECADISVDIACGLGQKAYVAGLSAGGTLSAWVAQNRGDVTRVVLIAPALGLTRHDGTRLQKGIALAFSSRSTANGRFPRMPRFNNKIRRISATAAGSAIASWPVGTIFSDSAEAR